MTLEEAIERYSHNAEYERANGNLQGCLEFKQLVDWLKDYKRLLEQEPKTDSTNIPDGATNGDVFTIMFNKTFPKTIVMYKNDESRLTINPIFSREWWGTPYKEESEDKQNE